MREEAVVKCGAAVVVVMVQVMMVRNEGGMEENSVMGCSDCSERRRKREVVSWKQTLNEHYI